jgi:hypothetical protein
MLHAEEKNNFIKLNFKGARETHEKHETPRRGEPKKKIQDNTNGKICNDSERSKTMRCGITVEIIPRQPGRDHQHGGG